MPINKGGHGEQSDKRVTGGWGAKIVSRRGKERDKRTRREENEKMRATTVTKPPEEAKWSIKMMEGGTNLKKETMKGHPDSVGWGQQWFDAETE